LGTDASALDGLLPKAVNPENAKSRFFTSFRMTTKNNALRCRPERSEGSLASNLWRKAFEQQPVKMTPLFLMR